MLGPAPPLPRRPRPHLLHQWLLVLYIPNLAILLPDPPPTAPSLCAHNPSQGSKPASPDQVPDGPHNDGPCCEDNPASGPHRCVVPKSVPGNSLSAVIHAASALFARR
ncbi:hypothetical protein M427DRAFT_60043 [Gonapodya prolifera JEL478]|uniref:Hydrophobin n=1 Tax=Gonapodya prolifera (strain JEL478) TaxID=1344416 RepID=A0A139A586_GONPJ|nr:hypothetical protein M427DRAFT_60043 [Gonapodya prolifera JEL478]|eukprot:KXS11904.1 hypothetical protein M427DRAFT_60043 [Gonapodya prolifera JEL478]